MWIFTRYGFISAVKHNTKPNKMIVRARARDHLEQLASYFLSRKPKIQEDRTNDYHYRITISRKQFETMCVGLAEDVNYGNFKDVVSAEGKETPTVRLYLEVLHLVWNVMWAFQADVEREMDSP